jgi:class 3 adenylate cyclase
MSDPIIELPLAPLERSLRELLPADLYATAWLDQSPDNLERVFEHLRTLLRILYDYMPPQLGASAPMPGMVRHASEEGALMFTDLSGFTPLMEANADRGTDGARILLGILNGYFAKMLEVVGKSGGELLEFTGDALLVEFPKNARNDQIAQAVRAGLRMQRAMQEFDSIEAETGTFSLGQRVGIHAGEFLTADIGTPNRMEHVLLGAAVQTAKRAEGAGSKGRVCLTLKAHEAVQDEFRFEPGEPGHMLVVDDLSDEQLGTFDIGISRRRMGGNILLDRSLEGLLSEIESMINRVESLAAFIPNSILRVLIENAARREIPPDFPVPTIMFVNLLGLPEAIEHARPEEIPSIITTFSKIFARTNAAVEAKGGVLKKVTYHLAGSDMLIMFGVPTAYSDDPMRAAEAALEIRKIILETEPPALEETVINIGCQVGMAFGPVFSAEIGEPRGRREFNVLGDTVNTAARLMGKAIGNRILMTESMQEQIKGKMNCESLGSMPLKGKAGRLKIYSLEGKLA